MDGLHLLGADPVAPQSAPAVAAVPSSANPWLSAALGAMLGAFVFQPIAHGVVGLARQALGGVR